MISELGEAVASTAIDSTDEVAGIVVRFGSSFLGLSVSIGATPRSGSSAVRSSPEQKGRRMITDHRRPKFPVKAGDELQNVGAADFLLQRPLDRLDLPTNAPHAVKELGFLSDGLRHRKLQMLRYQSFWFYARTSAQTWPRPPDRSACLETLVTSPHWSTVISSRSAPGV